MRGSMICQLIISLLRLTNPNAITSSYGVEAHDGWDMTSHVDGEAVLHRNINSEPPTAIGAIGNWIRLDNGYGIYDASCGAGVSVVGHGSIQSVEDAVINAMRVISYVPSVDFTTDAIKELSNFLVDSTEGKMTRVAVYNGGSEAIEASVKMARQFHIMNKEPYRINFITRKQSYHGATLGALGLSGHLTRRAYFEDFLMNVSRVSPYYPYRGQGPEETETQYIQRLADELDAEFKALGPNTVAAFVAEPVVGAALGSVPGTPEYFVAIEKVCRKHGALLIFDEIMCGMGRTGTLHAWQQMGVVPDIQTIGKALAAGFLPASGMLLSKRVADMLEQNGGAFAHGHTFQGHPVVSAAALEVQRIIQNQDLLPNVLAMGTLLGDLLKTRLQDHPNVGDIHGIGLKWGIEFVKDKATKESFDAELHVAWDLHEMAMAPPHQLYVYPGTGTNNGTLGDHIQIMPPYNVSKADIHFIVDRLTGAINAFFAQPRFTLLAQPQSEL